VSKIEKTCQATILGSIIAVVLGGNDFVTENLWASFDLIGPRSADNLPANESGGIRPDRQGRLRVSSGALESIPVYTHVMPFDEDDEPDIDLALLAKLDPTPTDPSERFSWHYSSLLAGGPDPLYDIDALWGLAIDLKRQEEAISVFWPLTGHLQQRIAERANKAIASLQESLAAARRPVGLASRGINDAVIAGARFRSLSDVANSDMPTVTQSEALGELGTYATPESVMAIESALYRITDPDVRLRAISALGNIAAMDVDTDRIRDILEIMANSGSDDVALLARNTISRIPRP
jgi:hypothetical protein